MFVIMASCRTMSPLMYTIDHIHIYTYITYIHPMISIIPGAMNVHEKRVIERNVHVHTERILSEVSDRWGNVP